MSSYLVTGGAGFVGSALAKQLLLDNHQVCIIDNLSTGYIDNVPAEAVFIQGDCSQVDTISKLSNQYFDAIFHIAGQSSGEISFEDPVYDINCNTISTLLLLQYASKTNCRHIIYASTMSVYGDHQKQIVSETDETKPKSFYAIGKLASENYLRVFQETYGIKFTALRYFNIYGPGQNMENMKQGMVSIFLKQVLSNEYAEIAVKGSLERFRDFIYINDLVTITIASLTNAKMHNQIINVGTGIKTTITQVLEVLMESTKIRKEIKEIEGTLGDQFGIYSDMSKLNKCIDFEFTPFDKGVDLFVGSLKINNG